MVALLLAACDSLKGGWYWVRDVEGAAREQQEFYGIVDGIARKRGLRPLACEAARAALGCWRYRSGDGVFLDASIEPREGRYAISVYEWNVRQRAQKSLDIEAEALAALRARFGDKVVKQP